MRIVPGGRPESPPPYPPGRSDDRHLRLGYRAASVVLPRTVIVAILLAGALLAGCGGDLERSPVQRQLEGDVEQTPLGFPLLATKNTTRVAGKDPVADAAAVARAVYPGFSDSQRPQAVTLVDRGDWHGAVAAAVLAAPPVRAPMLLTDGDGVPAVTASVLDSLRPKGSPLASRVQAFRIGSAAAPKGLRNQVVPGKDPVALAAAIDDAAFKVTGQRSSDVVIASASDPRFAMPAAAWAAKSGDAVLFVGKDALPASTKQAIERRDKPSIHVLGPPSVIGDGVIKQLARLGRVRRIAGADPVQNAIAFARYTDGAFGWGVRDPGHGLTIARDDRPLDAAAAASLATNGGYAPLLLTDSATTVPVPLVNYLLDIQPGYQDDPVRGVYNHAWLMGDESAISVDVQARIDSLAEIKKVKEASG